MGVTEWGRLTRRAAADGLARRAFSAKGLRESTRHRLRETEPSVHAYATLMEDSARRQAAAADDELKRGRWRGPLHGIPVGVKDLCYTEGVPTQAGSRVLEGFVPGYDATVVRRLKEGGAVIVGKTVTHEVAYRQDVPPTRNPWNTDDYPGGSRGSSGRAVAVGSAFAAIGTDTGGSIRVPASVDGVVGLKPTYGRVSRYGVIPMSPTLDTVGPLTRTAEDCALMLGVIAGFDHHDAGSLEDAVPDYAGELALGVEGLRLGVDREFFFYKHVAADVRAAAEATVARPASPGPPPPHFRLPHPHPPPPASTPDPPPA